MQRKWILVGAVLAVLIVVPLSRVFAGAIPSGPNVQVTDAGLNETGATSPEIVAQGNSLYAVWEDERDEDNYDVNGGIYFARSDDGGATWEQNRRVTDPAYDAWADDPAIAVQPNGTIWVTWYQMYEPDSNEVSHVRLARSTDGGQTWTRLVVVNGVDGNEDMWRPDIAADENNVYLLYRYYNCQSPCGTNDPDGFTIALKVINPANLSTRSTNIVSDNLYAGRFTDGLLDDGPAVDLTMRNGVLCAAWEDYRERFAIFGSCSTDLGITWSTNVPISGDDGIAPKIELGPAGDLYAVYSTSTDSQRNMTVRHSTDRGATWNTPIPVTTFENDEVYDWALAVDENNQLVLGWSYGDDYISDAYISTSLDDGRNFSAVPVEDEQGTYPTVSEQYAPAVAVSGTGTNTRAFMIWGDDRNSSTEIWSQSFTLDSVAPSVPGNVTATGEDSSILVKWNASTDETGIQGYRVYRSTTVDGTYSEITPRLVTQTFYRDVELTGASTYFYVVAAVDGTGNTGNVSAPVSATAQQGTTLPLTGTLGYEPATGEDAVRLRAFPGGAEQTINNADQPRFSNDGARVYYRADESIVVRPVAGGQSDIFATAANLLEYDVAANEGNYATILLRSFPSTAPGGQCVVSEPFAYDELGRLTYTSEYDLADDLSLSADHRWMVYRYSGYCNSVAIGTTTPGDFCLVDLAASNQNCIEGAGYHDPDFSPTGTNVVFAADFTGQYEIWKATLQNDGTMTNYVQLTRGAANQPSMAPQWSTDGNWIVFQRDLDPGETEAWSLYAVRADGAYFRALNLQGTNPTFAGGGGPVAPPPDLSNSLYLPVVSR